MSSTTPATQPQSVLSVFQFENHEIRVVERDGKPWFVAKDITDALGYADASRAVKNHCKHSEILRTADLAGLEVNSRGMLVIPQGDVFRLTCRSTLPTAEKFELLVMDEILPSIQNHGHYSVVPAPALPSNPMEVLKLHYDVLIQHETEIKSLTSRTVQAEDMALEAATGIEEMKATFRLHEWQMTDLREAVHTKSKELQKDSGDPIGKFFALVWGFLKRYFRVSSYKGIPAIRFDEAKLIVTNLTKEQVGVAK